MSAAIQLDLLRPASERIARRYAEHRRKHPEVYDYLLALALKARARGYDRFGISALFEVARWDLGPSVEKDADGFRMNNDLRALYARELMANHDELRDFFETRTLRGR